MKKVSGMLKSVYMSIGRQGYSPGRYVHIPYCVELPVENGVLLYNVLTREIILLSQAEYTSWSTGAADGELKQYLVEHWFLIPDGIDARSLCYMFWHSHKARFGGKPGKIELCTILTTTECNARCPYCYEAGCQKRTMPEATALDVADYITSHCNPDHVHLKWFGGEPLCNPAVIDAICRSLRERDVNYDCSMVTNGYLLNQHEAEKLTGLWHLNRVQVTLDGTEDTYNQVKDITSEGSAFKRVLDNMEYLLKQGIRVDVRLNLSKENHEDLLVLSDMLKERFGAYTEYLSVYSKPLFEGESFLLTDTERDNLYDQYMMLEKHLRETGLHSRQGVPKIKHCQCMADDGKSVVILPGGELGLCEHHTDDEYIGTIYSDDQDEKIIRSWNERADEQDECSECFYYPACLKLKKCPGKTPCNDAQRRYLKWKAQAAMKAAYERR